METELFGFKLPLPPSVAWPVFLVLAGVAGFLVGALLRWAIRRWARRTRWELDDLILECFGGPLTFAFAIWGIFLGARFIPETSSHGMPLEALQGSSKIVVLLLFLFAALRFSSRWIDQKASKSGAMQHAAGILKPSARVLLVVIGTLIVLPELGVNIWPILTGLGVGGIAVALALQPSLSNFFAGITMLTDRQLRQGDFIHLESGLEGWVQTIGWRSTLVKTRENNVVIIPNLKLSESMITNYHLPHSWMIVAIPIGVSYESDPEKVRQAVLEEVQAVAKEKDFILSDPPASCRLHPGFGESSLDFSLRFTISGFEHLFEARDLVRRRIFDRFRKEGIVIPFPQRDIHVKQGSLHG